MPGNHGLFADSRVDSLKNRSTFAGTEIIAAPLATNFSRQTVHRELLSHIGRANAFGHPQLEMVWCRPWFDGLRLSLSLYGLQLHDDRSDLILVHLCASGVHAL